MIDIKRNLSPGGNATADFYSSRAANLLVGYAACVGLPDLTDAMESLHDDILGRWCEEDFFEAYTARLVKLGVDSQPEDEGAEDEIPF